MNKKMLEMAETLFFKKTTMNKKANIGYHTKFNEKVFLVKLKNSLKKASLREIQLTSACCIQELKRRAKK